MVEVIVRKLDKVEGDTEVWTVQKVFSAYFGFGSVQVGLNSYGHLVVRLFEDNYVADNSQKKEVLVVFGISESKEIVEYIKKMVSDDAFK